MRLLHHPTSGGGGMRPVRFFWTPGAFGVAVFVSAILVLGLPGRIQQGESGQAAIQMLDAMRRPFLAIKEVQTRLIRTGDVVSAGRELNEAAVAADDLRAEYRRLAQYNPELALRVGELSTTYEAWLASERKLFESYARVREGRHPAGQRSYGVPSAELAEAEARFLETMNKLGEGEEPIHRDIDRGRRAGHVLLGLSAALVLYSLGLVILFQNLRSRRVLRSREEMERRAIEESEANFRALADNANDSIIVAVEPGVHVFANRLAAEMIGYTVEELLSLSPREVLHPDEIPNSMERFRKRLARGGGAPPPPGRAESVRHKDGHYIPVEVTVARTSWRGRPASIVVTRDITQRKGEEEERAALYQQNRALLRQLLHVQEEERKRLAQEIHDDLGQALTAIMTNARMILANCPGCQPKYTEALRDIVSITGGVYDAVQRISRRLRPSALDDLGLMDALRAMVETSPLKKTGVDFTISFGGEVNVLEDSVKIAVYRILQECLTNIAKHSGADHVTISLERTPGGTAKGETVELVIEDNGRGIPPSAATRGLGLIGIRERVETLGGEFRLLSGPGKGTSVHAALPVSPAMERAGA